MRRFVESLAEQTQEVITRKAGFTGDLLKIKRQIEALIDEQPGSIQALEYLGSCQRFV